MKTCNVTGHRNLFGYDLRHPKWIKLKDIFKEIIIKNKYTHCITGMALGVDTVFALAVLELKDEGYEIYLECAIPCKEQYKKWNKIDTDRWHEITSKADKVTFVSNCSYNDFVMQKRNVYMVDNSDEVISVWNGSKGGTKNCIDYAKYKNRKITNIDPIDFSIKII